MSSEDLVKSLSDHLGRRAFLVKAGGASIAALAAAFGIPKVSLASCGNYECCALCYAPSPVNCSTSNCWCTWCWGCCNSNSCGGDNSVWRCCECFSEYGACAFSCNGSICSWMTETGGPGSC